MQTTSVVTDRTAALVWLTILAWQLVCLAMFYVYRHLIGPHVTAAYADWYGDIQATYGTFERLHDFVSNVCITMPATIISLRLFAMLSAQRTRWKVTLAVFAACEAVLVAVLTCSYETGFHYYVNQLGWALFGPPDNVYSFTNIVLHRIITWVFSTTPVVWTALLVQLTLAKGVMRSDHTIVSKGEPRIPEAGTVPARNPPVSPHWIWLIALAGPVIIMIVFLVVVIIFALATRA